MSDAEALAVRSRDLLESEVAAHWEGGSSPGAAIEIDTELPTALLHLDNSMREQIVAMTELKVRFT